MFRQESGTWDILGHPSLLKLINMQRNHDDNIISFSGKTMQIVSFIDVFMRLHTTAVGTATPISAKARVLCIVPINTIQNWLAEFNHWLPSEVR